jgi:hypothetical protein
MTTFSTSLRRATRIQASWCQHAVVVCCVSASLLLVVPLASATTTAAAPPPPSSGSNWTAHRLFEAAKPAPEGTFAVCLDGSPPLYYHSPGSGDGVDKWEIHMVRGCVHMHSVHIRNMQANGTCAQLALIGQWNMRTACTDRPMEHAHSLH